MCRSIFTSTMWYGNLGIKQALECLVEAVKVCIYRLNRLFNGNKVKYRGHRKVEFK